ncbi:MAG: aminotransferase class I/II-fold pyridoxal phosphate-dependent enzyme [Chloroflexi bacterium]|nr:aminotransferase class I/II-fold pyridoxal phosphate-dependent enzyme [Chloroflexota bacterium]MCH8350276.1 aminotransferase class I/II-fold pyridoxal phosphate-dependent enzyme [Chloroflexota bacterium]MCI0780785.1 aminotransferase class I/II-fold pyridoxal phosphate-dependent enzyme [Chloroflexota bacterium]MCI0786810.1 aminotransferase class I/II-fold pyridoxal phosphate-dependent enzyme [Chloroflexota bacterium]MCI0793574.1 aminotransferase class I/II-fold pyridoxal phosphate-dependent e
MRGSRLPQGGENVLQTIRAKRAEAEASGIRLLDLSIGEPKGPALLSARKAAAEAVMSEEEAMHGYQYNASPAVPNFAQRFIQIHVKRSFNEGEVDYLPIPGIKPMLGLLPLACGCAHQEVTVATTTNPGYPIPADWCGYHPLATQYALKMNPDNKFRFSAQDISEGTGLAMMNYPHNPSGQVATEDWLRELCAACSERGIRLFNDAAYIVLSHGDESLALSEVAPDYPDLSWAEAFTAAKLIGNGTGWHVGAMVGSPDFIGDLKEVKGKTDTGFVAPMAAGVVAAFENDQETIALYRAMYRSRLSLLIRVLTGQGMRLALEPAAGFFTLWMAPTHAFGRKMESAEHFNFMMIEETGLAGVHFPPYVRYAVCADVEAMGAEIDEAFKKAKVSYD